MAEFRQRQPRDHALAYFRRTAEPQANGLLRPGESL